ncbi:MAG TPA: GAF domain-containing SpoIIE family protein phosphatase [Acidobacteriota bacterium]|nr:GAF domain-containing SpoIIE family protein phosphatase [Acidobacteriota bacterium]
MNVGESIELSDTVRVLIRTPQDGVFDARIAGWQANPLALELHFQQPPPADQPSEEPIRFSVTTGITPLVSGLGRLRSSPSQPLSRRWLFPEFTVPKDAHQFEARLRPFLPAASLEASESADLQDGWTAALLRSSLHFEELSQLLNRIHAARSMDTLLREIMEAGRQIMQAEASSLFLLDRETGESILVVPTGPVSEQIYGRRIPAGKGLVGWVIQSDRPILVDDPSSDPRFFGEIAAGGFVTRSMACVLLKDSSGRITGVLQALNRRETACFPENEIPLFQTLAVQAGIAIEKIRYHQMALEKERIERDLELAREIQIRFLPDAAPQIDGVSLAGFSRPATQVGGDYFDYFRRGHDALGIVIADISGKGIAAALLMASLRSTLRALAEERLPAAEMLRRLNRIFSDESPSNRFVTLAYIELHPAKREMTCIHAGHNPSLLLDPETGEIRQLEAGGPVLGILKDADFQEEVHPLKPGQRILLYTDGVTEAQDPDEEMYGEERLAELLKLTSAASAETLAQAVLEDVGLFCRNARQHDDLTLVAVAINTL